jgi:hypothetical protein
VLELVAEHDERRLEALVDVDLDELAAVHVGVGLDRADERDMRSVDSCSSAARPRAVSDAATQRSAASVAGPASAATRRASRVDAGGGERLGERHGSATPSPRGGRAARPRRRRRRARRARAPAARGERLALQRDEPPASSRSMPASTKRRSRALTDVERLGQLRGGAARGRGRVVELVREPGGHRAERGEPLAVLLDRVSGSSPGATWRMTRRCTRGARARAGGSPRAGSSATRHARLGHHAHAEVAAGERRRSRPIQVGAAGGRPARARSPSTSSACAVPSSSSSSPRGSALLGEISPGSASRGSATAAHSRARRRRGRRTGRRAQVGDGDGGRVMRRQVLVDERDGHRALADRARHALDRARAHVAGHEHAGHARLEQVRVALERPAGARVGPARMKPRSSRATTPSSQSVRGAAPMNTKQASTSSSVAPRRRGPRTAALAGARRPRRRPPRVPCAPRRSASAAICSIR